MSEPRYLRIEFATEEAFRGEYEQNIAQGGIFVATRSEFAVRDPVTVEIGLGWIGERVALDGEVVHVVPLEMASTGASPGVAVQLHLPTSEIRDRFRAFVGRIPEVDERVRGSGRRRAQRSPARVRADVTAGDRVRLPGRTQNLSGRGCLVACEGEVPAVGDAVRLALTHPVSGESIDVDGRVVRHVADGDGEVVAAGVKFEVPEARRDEVAAFVADVRACEHSRRLGGISGSVAELGMERLLRMFGTCAPEGTLTLRSREQEGTVVFASGRIRAAQLGRRRGLAALAKLVSWSDGQFEFQARAEEAGDDDLDVEEALARVAQPGGTGAASGAAGPPPRAVALAPDARLSLDAAAAASARQGLSKTEEAILDLAQVGMSVQKVMEIIPEDEAVLRRALEGLVEQGLVRAEG